MQTEKIASKEEIAQSQSADSAAIRLGNQGHGNHIFRSRRRGQPVFPEEPGTPGEDVATP